MRDRIAALLAALVAALVAGAVSAATGPDPGWLTWGDGVTRAGDAGEALRPAALRPRWIARVDGRVTAQPLVVDGVPARGRATTYVVTSAGEVDAFSTSGYLRWQVRLGRLAHVCPQLDGYGVTGTPVADPAAGALYVADAYGRLHALDLRTGAELPGWPVVLFPEPRRELVWGALTLVEGGVYAGTASYCDEPMIGKLVRVDTATREVTSWQVVPPELGGGGGIWGWGGAAYSAARGSLYVVTGNAFAGGTNTGKAFSEAAGYGEHVVEVSRDLRPLASFAPELGDYGDADFVGSPVVFERPGCGELIAAVNKNATLFGFRSGALGAGPVFAVGLERANPANPVLSQAAWSAARNALYVVTGTALVRVEVAEDCSARVVWAKDLGTESLNGSPTIAGDTIWFGLSTRYGSKDVPLVLGIDAETGDTVARLRVGGLVLAAPTVWRGRLITASYTGEVEVFSAARLEAPASTAPSAVPGHRSFSDRRHGLKSTESGVFSTDDGGRTWRRVHDRPAARVLRLSARTAVIAVGAPPAPCGCATRQLYTVDGGRTWRRTTAIGDRFTGRAGSVFSWDDSTLSRIEGWPPASGGPRSRRVATLESGRFVSVSAFAGGAAALFDDPAPARPPGVLVVRAGTVERSTPLPDAGADIDAQRVDASAYPLLTVTGVDHSDPSVFPLPTVTWRSADGGETWQRAAG